MQAAIRRTATKAIAAATRPVLPRMARRTRTPRAAWRLRCAQQNAYMRTVSCNPCIPSISHFGEDIFLLQQNRCYDLVGRLIASFRMLIQTHHQLKHVLTGAQTAKSVTKPPAVRSIRTGPTAPSHGRSNANYPMQLGMQALMLRLLCSSGTCMPLLSACSSQSVCAELARLCRTTRWAAPCGCRGLALPTGCPPTHPPCSTRLLRRASLLPRQAPSNLAIDTFSRRTSVQQLGPGIQQRDPDPELCCTALQLPCATYVLLSENPLSAETTWCA